MRRVTRPLPFGFDARSDRVKVERGELKWREDPGGRSAAFLRDLNYFENIERRSPASISLNRLYLGNKK
jgi:hypothetical protein